MALSAGPLGVQLIGQVPQLQVLSYLFEEQGDQAAPAQNIDDAVSGASADAAPVG